MATTAAGLAKVGLAHVPALLRSRRAAAAVALKAIQAVPAAADDEQPDDSAGELSYADAEDTAWTGSGQLTPIGAGVAQPLAPGGSAPAAPAGHSKPTGGALVPAVAQGSAAAGLEAEGGQDAPPTHTAAPAYSAGIKPAGQSSFSLAAVVVQNGPVVASSAKLVDEPSRYPGALAPIPVAAAAAGGVSWGGAVHTIQPIDAKAAAGIREHEAGGGGAAVAPEGDCRLLQATATGASAANLSDPQGCSQDATNCRSSAANGVENVKRKGTKGAVSEKGRSSFGTGVGAALSGVTIVSKEAGGVGVLEQAGVLGDGKAANRAFGTIKREGVAGIASTAAAAAPVAAGGTRVRAAAIPLVVPAAADRLAMLKNGVSSGVDCKAEPASIRGARQNRSRKQQRAGTTATNDANSGAAGVGCDPERGRNQVHNACSKEFGPHGVAGTRPEKSVVPSAPSAALLELDKDLRQLSSKVAVATAPTTAGGPPSTAPATPVLTATKLPALVCVQASAVAVGAPPATPIAGRTVKAEILPDTGSVEVARLMPSTADASAGVEVVAIDVSDDESAGVGCDPKGDEGLQQRGDARPKATWVKVARVKNEMGAAEFGAAAATAPVVAGAEAIVGSLALEAAVAAEAGADQRLRRVPTAGTACATDAGVGGRYACGGLARGNKHGRNDPTPAGASGGVSIGIIGPSASTPFTADSNAARGAGMGESSQAVALGGDMSMAAVVNGQAAAILPLDVHQSSPSKPAAPEVPAVAPVASGSGLQAEVSTLLAPVALASAGSGAAAGGVFVGTAVGAAASSLPLLGLAELQPTVGATAAAKKEAVAARVGVGESEALAAGTRPEKPVVPSAPSAAKVESDKDLRQLPSKAAVAAAPNAAGGPPSTFPATPVVTATGLPALVRVQASTAAVVAAAAAPPLSPAAGRAVKAEILDDGVSRVEIAGFMSPTAAAAAPAEVIVIASSDEESVGASVGVGCDHKDGGGLQQPGDARPKAAGLKVAKVKDEVDAEFGAAAARAPVLAGAEPGIGALALEVAVAVQPVADQRVWRAPTAGTAGATDEGVEVRDACGGVARGGKHGRDDPTPAGFSGGVSVGIIGPAASAPFTAVANAAGGAGVGGSRQAVALRDEKSMAEAAMSPPYIHHSSSAEAAAPGLTVATAVASGSGLEAEAANPAGSSAEQLIGLGAAAGEELVGAAVGAAASCPRPLCAKRQPSAGATAATARRGPVAAGGGFGGSEIAAAGGQEIAQTRAADTTLHAAIGARNSAYNPGTATSAPAAAGIAIAPAPERLSASYKAASPAPMAAAPADWVMGKGTEKGCSWSAAGTVPCALCPDKAETATGIKKELDGEQTAVTTAGGTAAGGAESGALATAGGTARAGDTRADSIRLHSEVAPAAGGVPLPTTAQPTGGKSKKTAAVAGTAGVSQGTAAAAATASPGMAITGSDIIDIVDSDSEHEQDRTRDGRTGSDGRGFRVAAAVEPVLERPNGGAPAARTSMGVSSGNGILAAAGGQ